MKAKVTSFVVFVLLFTFTLTALGQYGGQRQPIGWSRTGIRKVGMDSQSGGSGFCPWCQYLGRTEPCPGEWKPPATQKEADEITPEKDPLGLYNKAVKASNGIPVVVAESVSIGAVASYYGRYFGNIGFGRTGAQLEFSDPEYNLRSKGQRTLMELLSDQGYDPHAPLTGMPDAPLVSLEGSVGAKECSQIRAAKFIFLSAFGIQDYKTKTRVWDLQQAGQIAMRFIKKQKTGEIVAAATQGTGKGSVKESMGIEAHIWVYTPDLSLVAHGTAAAVFEDTLLSEMSIAGIFTTSSSGSAGFLAPGEALTKCALRHVEDADASCRDIIG